MPQWVEVGSQTMTVVVSSGGEQPPQQPPIEVEEQEMNVAALLGLFAAGALAFAVLKEREK